MRRPQSLAIAVLAAEVAVELGLTEAAARKRYQRAMRRLHDALEEIP